MEILNLRARPELLPLLAKWHHQEWQSLNPGQTLEQRIEKMQSYLSDNFIPSTFIAIDDDVLGSAAIVHSDMDTHPEWTPWLASVYVQALYRSQGVGTRLVRHAMQQAQRHNIETLYLFTPDRPSFYRHLGWQVMSEEIYRGQSVFVMTASLNK